MRKFFVLNYSVTDSDSCFTVSKKFNCLSSLLTFISSEFVFNDSELFFDDFNVKFISEDDDDADTKDFIPLFKLPKLF